MAAYGLQRGIKGSEVQHISTHEYYRSLISQGEDLQANITQLLEEQEKARLVIAEAEQAKKNLKLRKGTKPYINQIYQIVGPVKEQKTYSDPKEIFAFAMETAKGNINNPLAKEIYRLAKER